MRSVRAAGLSPIPPDHLVAPVAGAHHLASHERIKALVPSARLILLLRDPVDRAHSNWTHLWNAGIEPEADFLTACRAEPERVAAG